MRPLGDASAKASRRIFSESAFHLAPDMSAMLANAGNSAQVLVLTPRDEMASLGKSMECPGPTVGNRVLASYQNGQTGQTDLDLGYVAIADPDSARSLGLAVTVGGLAVGEAERIIKDRQTDCVFPPSRYVLFGLTFACISICCKIILLV